MFAIEFKEDAVEDIRFFKKQERKRILEELEAQLSQQPDQETRNRKKLRPNKTAEWELRIDKFRVFYDIGTEGGQPIVHQSEGVPIVKTVTITRRARSINALLRRAERENVIVRSPDGREFVLAEVDDFNREIQLTRQNKQLMKMLDRRASQQKRMSFNEAKVHLGLR